MKKALITGITGQDGSYLAELLLQIPINGNSNSDASPDKHFAVYVAEEFGSNWVQAWYRFIVDAIKLA